MLDAHCQMLLDEFLENQETFKTICTAVLTELHKIVDSNGIYVNAIEGRVKTVGSLSGKLELKGSKYKTLSDITDLVGGRIITFYSEEVDKISAMVESTFDVDWNESVDKRKSHDPDQFGYMSLHYICRIPKSVYYNPDLPMVNEYRFEVQMRTALQHVWATAYHDTGYKSDIEVPKEYIRKLSRLAGMLEIADEEFSSIIGEISDYRRKVRELVQNGKFEDLSLDGDTFSSFLNINPFKSLNDRIAQINHAEIRQGSEMQYLQVLKSFGLNTIADIIKLRDAHSDDAYRLAVLQISGTDLDILSSTVALQNLCIVHIVKNGMGIAGLKNFYDILYGKRERNYVSAKRTFNQAKSLALVKDEE